MLIERPDITAVTAALELVASERPDHLSWLLDVLEHSPVRAVLSQLVDDCQEDQLSEFETAAARSARHLNRLEMRRSWRKPSQVVDRPNVAMLWRFAKRRSERTPSIRSRRLQMTAVKLKRIYDIDQQRRELEAFMRQPSAQTVDLEWLHNFLKPPSRNR